MFCEWENIELGDNITSRNGLTLWCQYWDYPSVEEANASQNVTADLVWTFNLVCALLHHAMRSMPYIALYKSLQGLEYVRGLKYLQYGNVKMSLE